MNYLFTQQPLVFCKSVSASDWAVDFPPSVLALPTKIFCVIDCLIKNHSLASSQTQQKHPSQQNRIAAHVRGLMIIKPDILSDYDKDTFSDLV